VKGSKIMDKLQLAMSAGARAIETNKRLKGSTFVSNALSDNPQEISYEEAAEILRTADVAEVRHGKWIYSEHPVYGYAKVKCSVCDYVMCDISLFVTNENYCPHCGAKMDEK